MKKLFSIFFMLVLTGILFAQSPQKISYQCVVRDKDGVLVTKQLVGMRTTILQGSDIQHVVYQETYNFTATNDNGLLTVEIGSGKPTIASGQFSSIPWSAGPIYLQTEIDPTGGTNYSIVGKSQILSVPYALYAEATDKVTETDPLWSGVSSNYYTKSNLQTRGEAIILFSNLTNTPTTLEGYGIIDGVNTTGNQTIDGVKTFNSTIQGNITGNAATVTNGVYSTGSQRIAGNKEFTGSITVPEPVNPSDAVSKAYLDNILKAAGIVPSNYAGYIRDFDNNAYTTVTIGSQTWMAQNLKTTRYNYGEAIPLVTDSAEWLNLTSPGYCWYNNEAANKDTYGSLYNWYAVNTHYLCPIGWHVPTDADWTILATYLGGENIAGGKLKETGTTHWVSPNVGATNETNFTALPGGRREDDGFKAIGLGGYWWSSTDINYLIAWIRTMSHAEIEFLDGLANYKNYGYSVRCLKD